MTSGDRGHRTVSGGGLSLAARYWLLGGGDLLQLPAGEGLLELSGGKVLLSLCVREHQIVCGGGPPLVVRHWLLGGGDLLQLPGGEGLLALLGGEVLLVVRTGGCMATVPCLPGYRVGRVQLAP